MGQIVKTNGSLTVKSLRRAVGVRGHRPSGKNTCVGKIMKTKSFKSKPGEGGRNNKEVRLEFVKALKECDFKLSDATKKKFGI